MVVNVYAQTAQQRPVPYLRLLFWLKLKLMFRGYRRSPVSLVGVVITLIVMAPLSAAVAAFCYISFRSWVLAPHLLRAVLTGIYILWLIAPLLGYALNDSYDITRLFIYPVTVRQIFAGAVLGSLADFPVLFLLPTVTAVVAGFGRDAATALAILAVMALFLAHTFSLSQAVLLASSGLLRSRRYRDMAILLIPIVSMIWYVGSQTLAHHALTINWQAVSRSPVWSAVGYLPPGLAGHAVAALARGAYASAGAYCGALLLVTAGALRLAGWTVERVYSGEVTLPAQGVARAEPLRSQAASSHGSELPGPLAALPPAVQAMARKEFLYQVRDPYFRMVLMNVGYMLCVAVYMVWSTGTHAPGISSNGAMIWASTWIIVLMQAQLVCNIFGTDGGAAMMLFSTPAPRSHIVLGKNLSHFAALSLVNTICSVVITAVDKHLSLAPMLFCFLELASISFMALGNLVSIYFPVRMVLKGGKLRQQTASRGCGYSIVYMIATATGFLLLIPVLAGIIVPLYWMPLAWLGLSIPLAILYAAGLYGLSLYLAEPLLVEREFDLLAKVTQSED
ncbi:MAG TPA: hypothetical protein VGS41_03865 [Chthonomonadales bacterium]|nr:hypothetical protein [Chthonomonadales bacterium]